MGVSILSKNKYDRGILIENFSAAHDDNVYPVPIQMTYLRSQGDEMSGMPHSHQFTEIFFAASGSGRFFFNGKTIDFAEGDLIIVPPNVMHMEIFSHMLEFYVIGLDKLKRNFTPGPIQLSDNEKEYYHFIFAALFEELHGKKTNYIAAAQNLFRQLMLLIARKAQGDFSEKPPETKPLNHTVETVRSHIEKKFADTGLKQLAEIANVTPYHLIRLFRNSMGYTPVQYCFLIKVLASLRLLLFTNDSVTDISVRVGFKSTNAYIKKFQDFTGMTPARFRKGHIGKEIPEHEAVAYDFPVRHNADGRPILPPVIKQNFAPSPKG